MAVTVGDFELAREVAEWIETVAIAAIAVAVVVAVTASIRQWFKAEDGHPMRAFKRRIAGGLLVGLDLLIAADIIKSVTIDHTLANIAGLGLLVLIRTFLSWTLVVEGTGRWPWKQIEKETVSA